jgi:ADP-ribose pyrophosphatase YjhB (NUDIX family)
MDTGTLLESLKRLKAIADVGLLYCENGYDRERYEEMHKIVFDLLNGLTGYGLPSLALSFPQTPDYPTAKVDIRGITLSADHKILLVKEATDGKWSLPGGWADIGYSPLETVIKETKEETGIEVTVHSLIAVFDKRLHPHPPHSDYVYKMVFYCQPVSAEISHGFDVAGAAFFDLENLPALSAERILKSQVALVYNKIMAGDFKTYFE